MTDDLKRKVCEAVHVGERHGQTPAQYRVICDRVAAMIERERAGLNRLLQYIESQEKSRGDVEDFKHDLTEAVSSLLDKNERYRALLTEITRSAVSHEGPQIGYLEIQIDRATWDALREFREEPKP